jgi:hypothetical protein
MGIAAKERKERREKEITLNSARSIAHLMGEAGISPKGLALRSLRSFAAIHRRI